MSTRLLTKRCPCRRTLFGKKKNNRQGKRIASDRLSNEKPLKPTWTIDSLLQNNKKTTDAQTLISDKQFKHLLSLARINVKDEKEASRLKSEIHQLQRITETIKNLDQQHDTIAPLTHLWKQDKSLALRDDNLIETDPTERRGRALLDHAEKKSGYFYTVEQKVGLQDMEE
ncbi:hypothetical protein BDF20DRAFT_911016 [Mycotypha africana]|uniref:uncharacterized protein n=1 Tax=Mycotypha africana TaxID=64632 RepID=UPI00230154F4|nr:uncharacterized protein BDF20DRAFT_911016 [Mycotypha africana]KAI8988557.1 hypothetical protein BDF20DRAFT_911016 [Mycotypha africana]